MSAYGYKSTLEPKEMTNEWNTGIENARKAIQSTTSLCSRNTTNSTLNRRYQVNDKMIQY